MHSYAPGFGPQLVKQAPENEIHKALSGIVGKRDQGLIMGLLREYNLLFDPRTSPPKDLTKAMRERVRMYLLHQVRTNRALGDRTHLRYWFQYLHQYRIHEADQPYPQHIRAAVYYVARELEAHYATIERKYQTMYDVSYGEGCPTWANTRTFTFENKVLENDIRQPYYEARAAREEDAQYQT